MSSTGEFYVSFGQQTNVSLWDVSAGVVKDSASFEASRDPCGVSNGCKRESAPAIGRTGAPLVLRVAEPELAREPRTPGAERQGSSAQARRLHELRSEFRFTGLTKKIRMTLAVIPQMRLRKHGLPPFNSQDAEQSLRLPRPAWTALIAGLVGWLRASRRLVRRRRSAASAASSCLAGDPQVEVGAV